LEEGAKMNNKSNVNFRLLISTALVSGMFFTSSSQAGNLREAPELPSIEVNFGAIEKLKAETKQLEKLAKLEAEQAAKAAAAEEKKQLEEKKKAVADEKLAKLEKKHTKKIKTTAAKTTKKQNTKVAKANKKRTIALAPVKKPVPKIAEKVLETPKVIANKTVESHKVLPIEVAKPQPVIAAKITPDIASVPVNNLPTKSEATDLKAIDKGSKVADLAPLAALEPEPSAKDNAPSFLQKISNFFAEKPVEPAVISREDSLIVTKNTPLPEAKKIEPISKPEEKKPEIAAAALPEEAVDEEEIAAKEYADHEEDLAKSDERDSIESASSEDSKIEGSKDIILPKKIETATSKSQSEVKESVLEKTPPIPPLADFVELKQAEPEKLAAPSYKDVNDEEWKKVLEDARKKASGVMPEGNPPKESNQQKQPLEAPKEVAVAPAEPVKTEPKVEKVSIISSVIDWMPSFAGEKSQSIPDSNDIKTASSEIAGDERHTAIKPENLSVKTSENEVSAQTEANEVVGKKPEIIKNIELKEPKNAEVKPIEIKQPDLVLAPLPQIESVALPTNLKPKSEAFSINFKGAEMEISESDKNHLSEFVKNIISSKSKVKIVSSSPSVDNDINSARRISLKRAIAIRAQMIEYGLDSGRINVQAIGNQESNSTNVVDILLIEGGAS
jgi:hypothetical protein